MTIDTDALRRRGVRNDARTVVSSLVSFDPTQDKPQRKSDIASKVFSYMLTCPEAWIYDRALVHAISNLLDRGTRTILHGEKGTGKSTVLRTLENQFDAANHELGGPAERLFVVIDFNYNSAYHLGASHTESEGAITDYVLQTIEPAVFRSSHSDRVNDQRELMLVQLSPHFSQLRSALRRDRIEPETLSIGDLHDTIRKKPYRAIFQRNDRTYHEKTTTLTRSLDILSAGIRGGLELVISLDNLDQLPLTAKKAIANVAQSVASLSDQRIGVVVACRSEHLSLVRSVLDPGKTWDVPSMPLPETSTCDIQQIVYQRLALLESEDLLGRLLDQYPEKADSDLFRAELTRSRAQVRNTMTQLWNVAEPRGSDDQNELARSLVYWHNGNIRDTSQSITALSETNFDPRHLEGKNVGTGRRRARNLLYRHLVVDRLSSDMTHGNLSRSVKLFAAQREATGKLLPFYFFRYRMLAHLAYKRAKRPVSAIQGTFAEFGLSADRTTEVIDSLTSRESFDSGFVRLETDSGPVDSVSEGDDCDSVFVELLPSGEYFTNDLVVKCEFLYWNALDIPECLDELCRLARVRKDDVLNRLPSELEKVVGSTVFVRDYLIPRFREEHPYMIPGSDWSDEDVERLQMFRSNFGYDKNNWFVLRLKRSIAAYAKEAAEETNQLVVPHEVHEAWATFEDYARQLNRVMLDEH